MNSLKVLAGIRNLCRVQTNFMSTLSTGPDMEEEPKKAALEKTINQVTLLGRVGGDPQKRGTTDHPVVLFSVATHNSFKYESGEFAEKTDWHRVCVFKPALRDLVFTYLRKGQRVHVSGKITYGSVTDSGQTKAVSSIIADDIIFFYQGDT